MADPPEPCTDPLTCGLCHKRYNDPRILDCFHSFCCDCIEKHAHASKGTFPCPMCHMEIHIPKTGIKGLHPNYYVRAIQASAVFSTNSKCDTCKETEKQAQSRCLECNSNFCKPCVSRHSKEKETRDHHMVELSAPDAKSVTKIAHRSFCEKHHEETVYYCILCEIPICKDCVTKVSDHKGHRYKNIVEGAKEKRNKVKPMIQSMHEYLPCLQDYLHELNSTKKLLGDYAEQTVQEIKARYKYLQEELLKICNALVEGVEEKVKNDFNRIDSHVQTIDKTLRSVSTITKSAEEAINLGSDSEVVLMCQKLQNRFKHADKEIPQVGLTPAVSSNFHVGDLQSSNLQEMFGSCDTTDIKLPMLPIPWGLKIALNFDVQLMYSFKVANVIDTIHAIAPLSEREAWICNGWGTQEMNLYSREGEKLRTVKLDIQIDDIITKPNGDILVSSYDDKKIIKLDGDLKQTDFVKLDLYPGGMTYTKRNELLVCAVDSYVTTRNSKSRRMIMRISEAGKIIDMIEDDGFSAIFTAPYRLHENMLGDIVVSDREEAEVHTTTITLDGFVKNKYVGQKDYRMKKPFNPFGIVSDKHGHVLVADWSNHAIHLLDLSGQFIGFLITENYGIRGPNALALDKEGHLWVGDTKSTVWVFKYARRVENNA
uniref:Tripartite motif-containing protein 45-like n=1 Tax=Crassostrea virginica TaxID=6565 RepID=A0A8B8D097_CRAVI|nr:tripartite motif-containing protein 45-like [Crassostrea virginica]